MTKAKEASCFISSPPYLFQSTSIALLLQSSLSFIFALILTQAGDVSQRLKNLILAMRWLSIYGLTTEKPCGWLCSQFHEKQNKFQLILNWVTRSRNEVFLPTGCWQYEIVIVWSHISSGQSRDLSDTDKTSSATIA